MVDGHKLLSSSPEKLLLNKQGVLETMKCGPLLDTCSAENVRSFTALKFSDSSVSFWFL